MKQTPFKSLATGDVFRFSSERLLPYSGMMRGPWVKLSARRYHLLVDESFVCTVGSINVDTDPVDLATLRHQAAVKASHGGR